MWYSVALVSSVTLYADSRRHLPLSTVATLSDRVILDLIQNPVGLWEGRPSRHFHTLILIGYVVWMPAFASITGGGEWRLKKGDGEAGSRKRPGGETGGATRPGFELGERASDWTP